MRVVCHCLFSLLTACGVSNAPVTGLWTWEFVSQQEETVLRDLSAYRFSAYVIDEAGVKTYAADGPVEGTVFGRFEIPDVPSGPFLLRVDNDAGTVWFAHENHTTTRSTRVLGRPNASAASRDTQLHIEASGLAPWSTNDLLIATCWENATQNFGIASSLTPKLATGATAIQAQFDWGGESAGSSGPGSVPYLMDSRQGDTLTVTRHAQSKVGDVSVLTLTQVMGAVAPAQQNGAASSVAGSFVGVPLDNNLSFGIDLESFGAEASERGLDSSFWSMALYSGPGTRHGLLLGPPLVSVSGEQEAGQVQQTLGFGNPFDANWPLSLSFALALSRSIVLPGTRPLDTFWMPPSLFWERRLMEDFTHNFEPRLPPSRVSLNGVHADEHFVPWNGQSPLELRIDGADEAATVAVEIYRIDNANGSLQTERTLHLLLGRVRVQWLPPELFELGNYYMLRVGVASGQAIEANDSGSWIVHGKIRIDVPSASACGDGVVDLARGEVCDDGGAGACSATCT